MTSLLAEIIAFAKQNNKSIGYYTAVDMLKEKKEGITENEIDRQIGKLGKKGISVIDEEDSEDYNAEDAIDNIFIPSDVNITPFTTTVSNLMDRLENDEIELRPSFQRHSGLWTSEQQSQLIESLMLKIPIPMFYFNAAIEGKWIVIDGLQRLTAFRNYLVGVKDENNIVHKERLNGLQYLKDFNNKTFDELPRQYMRRIRETQIPTYLVERGTPDEVVFNIFKRINTGGLVLSSQEIRQALYDGASTRLIERMAESKEFQQATQGMIKSNRMQDREYATRFLAFTELNYEKEYFDNIDLFLIKCMKRINQSDEAQIDRIETRFKAVMKSCYSLFGEYAFRKYDIDHYYRRGPINKAIFETWSICLCELSGKQRKTLIAKKEIILEEFGKLQKDEKFNGDLRSGKLTAIERRIACVRALIKEQIND